MTEIQKSIPHTTLESGRNRRPSKFIECREAPGYYQVERIVSTDDIVDQARSILAGRCAPGRRLESARDARDYLMHELNGLDHEVFGAIFLDQHHSVLAIETLFRGTVSSVYVRLREVARRALAHNASALIAFHNHPSGDAKPSRTDEIVTARLKSALDLVDVRLVDHLVIAAGVIAHAPGCERARVRDVRKTSRRQCPCVRRTERAP
jgi:DNA repair protein RadC